MLSCQRKQLFFSLAGQTFQYNFWELIAFWNSPFLWQKQVTPSAFINFCYQAQIILTFSMIDSEKIWGSVYKKSANLLSTTLLWCLFIVLGGWNSTRHFLVYFFFYIFFSWKQFKSHIACRGRLLHARFITTFHIYLSDTIRFLLLIRIRLFTASHPLTVPIQAQR